MLALNRVKAIARCRANAASLFECGRVHGRLGGCALLIDLKIQALEHRRDLRTRAALSGIAMVDSVPRQFPDPPPLPSTSVLNDESVDESHPRTSASTTTTITTCLIGRSPSKQ